MNNKKEIAKLSIKYEEDVVLARQKARRIAYFLGFDPIDQTKIATAVSEITRNVIQYAEFGTIVFSIKQQRHSPVLNIEIIDRGPGIIETLKEKKSLTTEGKMKREKSLGIGIPGSRSVMDYFKINSIPGVSTTVQMGKRLPSRNKITVKDIDKLVKKLESIAPESAYEEVLHQNQELMCILADAEEKKNQLEKLNMELEERNRGILALYRELEDRLTQLREMNEMKSRFLLFVSHDLRTPISAILSLTSILLEECEGKLSNEQRKQIVLIKKSAESLHEMVNNLLDLGKIERKKLKIYSKKTSLGEIVKELKSIVLLALKKEKVQININNPENDKTIYTDTSRAVQVLRNVIENGLKYTDEGYVELKSRYNEEKNRAEFFIEDTGTGISEEIKAHIFDEYVKNGKNKAGIGLGLSIARYIARLLGGDVELLRSEVGKGSLFLFWIPRINDKI